MASTGPSGCFPEYRDSPTSPALTDRFWDCECQRDFFRFDDETECDRCGARKEDQPEFADRRTALAPSPVDRHRSPSQLERQMPTDHLPVVGWSVSPTPPLPRQLTQQIRAGSVRFRLGCAALAALLRWLVSPTRRPSTFTRCPRLKRADPKEIYMDVNASTSRRVLLHPGYVTIFQDAAF